MIADELEINEEGDKQTLVNDIANALEDVSADIWYREQQIVYWQKSHKKNMFQVRTNPFQKKMH